MSDKIISIGNNKRLSRDSGAFVKRYPRIERMNREMHPIGSGQSISVMEDIPPDGFVYVAAKDEPVDNVSILKAFPLNDRFENHNEILFYRILSGLYDKSDILSLLLGVDSEGNPMPKKGATPLNWGFTLKVSENLYAEIRTKSTRQVGWVCFWRKSVLSKSKLENLQQEVKEFVRRMQGLFDQNLHLFSEDEILNREPIGFGTANIFKDRYDAAERLLDVARGFDGPVVDWAERSLSNKPIVSGAIYFSSAMLFFVALEALVNLLYDQLLKEEFKQKIFDQHLKANLKIRICTMHLYCKGFDKPALTAGDDLWGRYEEIEKVRNHYIHGNISAEDKVYGAMEDGLLFYYQPRLHYRGKKKFYIYDNSLAFADEEFVQGVKEVVDLTLSRVIEAMGAEHRKFVKSWVNDSVIQTITVGD